MPRFYTVAREETNNWDSEVLKEHGIVAAFGLYLIKEGEATYCCSMSPSSWAVALQNAFVFSDDATEAQKYSAYELDFEGLESCYLNFWEKKNADSRFFAGPITIRVKDCTNKDEQWQQAQDAWNSNPDHPPIVWDEGNTWQLWQDELTAKRRTENRAVLSLADPLPLFVVAANAIAAKWGQLEQTSLSHWRQQFAPLGWMKGI